MRNQPVSRRTMRLFAMASRHSFVRFAAFGLVGLAVDLTLVWILATVTPLPDLVCVTLAFFATYGMNFVLNRRFAFHGTQEPALRQLARFAPQLAVDWILVVVAVEALTWLGLPLLAARLLAAGTNAIFNYVSYRWWTFAPAAPHTPLRELPTPR